MSLRRGIVDRFDRHKTVAVFGDSQPLEPLMEATDNSGVADDEQFKETHFERSLVDSYGWKGMAYPRDRRSVDEIDFLEMHTSPPSSLNPMANLQMSAVGQVLINVAIQIHGLVKTTDRSYTQLLTSIHAILMAVKLDGHVYSWIVNDILYLVLGKTVRPESLEDFGEALGKDAIKYMTSNLTNIVERVVKFCSAALLAPSLMKSKAHYFKNIGYALDKAKLSSFSAASLTTEGVISMLAHCVTRGLEYIVNWSFPDEVNDILKESTLLRQSVDESLLVMDRETRDDMVQSLQGMSMRLTSIHLRMRGDKFTVAQALLKELELVVKLKSRTSQHAIEATRVPAPISINIVGEPAIGKTEITNLLLIVIASVKNKGPNGGPYLPKQVCKATLSRFWNSMTNDTKVVVFDDLNASVRAGEKTEAVHGKWAEGLIQLNNNTPFKPELAEAHMKGTVQPRLDAIISTSNWENRYGNTPGMGNKEAVFRRFHMMHCELKDEYRSDDGHLDVSKVRAAGDSIYEVNPWKMSLLKFNLKKSRESKRDNKIDHGIDDSLWEHVTFKYGGEMRKSDDMTFDMLRELFVQMSEVERDAGAMLEDMSKSALHILFPNMAPVEIPAGQDIVNPETISMASRARTMCRENWFLNRSVTLSATSGWFIQGLCLMMCPFTSVCWLLLRVFLWRPPGWTPDRRNRLGFGEYFTEGIRAAVLQYKILVLCFGFSVATGTAPYFKWLVESMGVDLGEVFHTVMFGGQLAGVVHEGASKTVTHACEILRDSCSAVLAELAKKERSNKLKRVLRNGIFAGLALGTLVQVTQWIVDYRKMSRIFSDPTSIAESTVSSDGVINVDVDYKVDVAPRHKVFKGTYHTMPRTRLSKPIVTQTPEDARRKVAGAMYRMTIVACTGSQLKSVVRSECKTDMYVVGYCKSTVGTYMLTVAHAFAKDSSHFCVTVHDPPRVAKEHVLPKSDIVFSPKLNFAGGQHDIDLCMFELPRSVLGDLPVIQDHIVDSDLERGTNLVRLVPSCNAEKGIVCVDHMNADYVGIKSFTYTRGSLAAAMMPSPIALWIEGAGDDGLCGSIIMSGGAVVAMHTGSNKPTACVTASPLTTKLLVTMRSQLISRQSGVVPSFAVDNMCVCPPYLSECTSTDLVIDPDVKILDPGALSPTLVDKFCTIVGTLKKRDGLVANVKAKTNIGVSPHIDKLLDFIPDVSRLVRDYGTPSSHFKMHDTVKAFVDKSLIPRPDDSHLRSLAKQKVGGELYTACSLIIEDQPDFARMRVLNMQSALDGMSSAQTQAKFNMGNGIPLTTSSGIAYPGVKSDYMSKVYSPEYDKHFICFHEDNEISMEMRDNVYDIIDRRKNGDVGLTLNFMCPKDEVLPIKADGRTKPCRHINKTDIADIVVIRMFFQPVLVLLGYDPLSCGHSVGLDPTVNYLEMVKSLINGNVEDPLYAEQVTNSSFVATDYSGFDLSLSGSILSAVMDILINLTFLLDYSDEDRRVMSSIAYDLCNPSVVMLGTIVQLAGVNTSGNPLTTMINCVSNMIINCQIHAMIRFDVLNGKYMVDYARDYSSMTVSDMDFDLRRIVTYGDDVVVRVDKESPIDQPATIYYGKQLGYVITGSDKGDTVTKYAESFAFLKRKYHLYVRPSDRQVVMCLAPLAADSIYKPFVWGDFKKVDVNDYYTGLVKSALHELVQHGRQVYDDQAPLLWSFVQSFVIETKAKKGKITMRTGLASRFRHEFLSWEDAVRERYGRDLDRIEGELTLSELELIEL